MKTQEHENIKTKIVYFCAKISVLTGFTLLNNYYLTGLTKPQKYGIIYNVVS
jgi:hypothetical protein